MVWDMFAYDLYDNVTRSEEIINLNRRNQTQRIFQGISGILFPRTLHFCSHSPARDVNNVFMSICI